VYMMDMYYDMQRGVMDSTWELGLGKMVGQDGSIEDYRILVICKIQLFTLHRIYLRLALESQHTYSTIFINFVCAALVDAGTEA